MIRVLGIELRRSAAPGSALLLAVVGVVLLFFADGIGFATGWMQLAMVQRLYLAVLWPLALAAGAWQGRREHRSNVTELFASTPRPMAHRTVPTLGAMAIAVVGGYLAMGVAGGLWIIGTAEYLPVQVFVVAAVGGLALVAAAYLGLAVGRLLPWAGTAVALSVAGLGLLLSIPAATRPRGWLALVFSPIYEMNMPAAYTTVPGRVSAAQAAWLAALAVAAVMVFASGSWHLRVAASLPVVMGAALAIALMPHQNRYVTDAIDPVARQLVCTGDQPLVCVSRVHSGLLTEVSTRAREGLAVLARLPDAPTQVHEDTTTYFPEYHPRWRPDVVLLDVEVGHDGHLDGTGVLANVVTGAFASPPDCEHTVGQAEKLAAASWLIGRAPAAGSYDAADVATASQLWQALRQQPDGQAKARVAALRQAAQRCSPGGSLTSPGTP